jgi:nucleoside-diphosphate-sugar epimerase
MMKETHVVFGTGPLGLAVMRQLAAEGRRVRGVNRSGRATVAPGVEMTGCDVTHPESVQESVKGAAVIYHCVNPPYTRWPQEFPAIQKGIINGAASVGAKLIFGDNLYGYGPVDRAMTEDMPYRAQGPNGRIRAEMASMLMEAHRSGKIKAAIGRGSDFFGPHVLLSNMGERVFRPVLVGKAAQVLGNPDMPHTYIFIDDFARGLITLGEREEALGQIWHIPAAETMTTRAFLELVFAEVSSAARISQLPRFLINVLARFSPLMRAVKEQLYQFEAPFVVDHGKFAGVFGANVTPHRDAIRQTIDWYRAGSTHTR